MIGLPHQVLDTKLDMCNSFNLLQQPHEGASPTSTIYSFNTDFPSGSFVSKLCWHWDKAGKQRFSSP